VQRANTQKVIESRKGQGGVCPLLLHMYVGGPNGKEPETAFLGRVGTLRVTERRRAAKGNSRPASKSLRLRSAAYGGRAACPQLEALCESEDGW